MASPSVGFASFSDMISMITFASTRLSVSSAAISSIDFGTPDAGYSRVAMITVFLYTGSLNSLALSVLRRVSHPKAAGESLRTLDFLSRAFENSSGSTPGEKLILKEMVPLTCTLNSKT